jgi:drug/metabolite transporter (DMT)-like permease
MSVYRQAEQPACGVGEVLLKSEAATAKEPSQRRAWLQIHFCVVLWGFTAILGKLITLPALQLVWWRMFLVTAALLFVPSFWSGVRRLAPRLLATYAGIGMLVALHWLTFYASIKLSNASVAVTCLAVAPLCIAFTEPLLARRPIDMRELLLGLAVIPGVVLVVGGTPSGMHLGIAVGGLSALLMAIFNSLNKRFVTQGAALSVTGIEMGAGAGVLTVATLALPTETFMLPNLHDGVLLAVLAMGCTLLPFALALIVMRQLSAFSTGLVVNLEPVYAIVLAIVLLGEQRELDRGFYVGVAIILLAVFSHPWLRRRE